MWAIRLVRCYKRNWCVIFQLYISYEVDNRLAYAAATAVGGLHCIVYQWDQQYNLAMNKLYHK